MQIKTRERMNCLINPFFYDGNMQIQTVNGHGLKGLSCFCTRDRTFALTCAFNQALTDSRSWAGQSKLFAQSPMAGRGERCALKKKPIKQT